MIESSVRELALRYQARVDWSAFEGLYEIQERSGKLKLLKGLESFVYGASSARMAGMRERLDRLQSAQISALRAELSVQDERLIRARIKLEGKETKTLLNELRIAQNKVTQIQERIDEWERQPPHPERIFPGVFAPLLVAHEGQRWIRPFRYQLRPSGEAESFDRKFNGTYNVRRDRLNEVRWWRNLYGKKHGLLVMRRFYEHVEGAGGRSMILEFREEPEQDLLVPCLYDRNEEGQYPLDSFGLITDDPNPEVLAAGHDRTPIVIRPDAIDEWLDTRTFGGADTFDRVLAQKQPTRFLHRPSR
jgi:putative SOS response-associated peptidase YedK